MNLHPHIERGRKDYRAGCRCASCVASWAAYNRERRQARKSQELSPEGRDTHIQRDSGAAS